LLQEELGKISKSQQEVSFYETGGPGQGKKVLFCYPLVKMYQKLLCELFMLYAYALCYTFFTNPGGALAQQH
jgi:hypothetical protein